MAFNEAPERLASAGLMLHLGPTKRGLVGAETAENVEVFPIATITKRDGYKRWRPIQENYPVTGLVRMDEKFLIMAGDLDERDV